MKKLKEFLKRNTGTIMLSLAVLLGCYLTTTCLLLKYILENGMLRR